MNGPDHPPRLRRLDRTFAHRSLYFVTFCTHERARLLANSLVHDGFTAFARNAEVRGVYVGRYVLMPDHLHLFASLPNADITLSKWTKSLKNFLSKTLRDAGHQAPHWQKGFFDHLMRSSESYSLKWDYVRENPVRAGLCPTAEAWPYQGMINDLYY